MRGGAAFFIAERYLFGRKGGEERRGGRNYLRGAALGVALSLVPLVVVLVVADGMIEGITARYLETATYHLQVAPYFRKSGAALEETARNLERRRGITGAFAEVQGPAVIIAAPRPSSADGAADADATRSGRSSGAALRAVDPRFLEDAGAKAYLRAVSGELRLERGNEILLGEALAKTLGVGPGDLVSIVTAQSERSESVAARPKVTPFRVRGVLSSGYRELDALWALIPLRAAGRVLAPETSRSFIGVKVLAPFGDLEGARRELRAALESDEGGGTGWSVATWKEVERNLFTSFSTTRALLLLVMTLAVAVAAVNVGSALVMLVVERRRDLAILKSAGASNAQIGFVFLLSGCITGGVGGLAGIGLGALLAWRVNELIAGLESLANLAARFRALLVGAPLPPEMRLLDPAYYLERIPVRLEGEKLLLVFLLCIVLCLVASLLPARRAARLPPLEIFRKT